MWEDIWRSEVPPRREMDRADREYRRWVQQEMRHRHLVAFLACSPKGEVLGSGCVLLQPRGQPIPGLRVERMPYLLSMYTEPDARGTGVASRIVSEAIHWSQGMGYRRMSLNASKMGRAMYGRLGFRRTWQMALRLRNPSTKGRSGRPGRSR